MPELPLRLRAVFMIIAMPSCNGPGREWVGDEVIRDMGGHVSKDMLKHYSHI